MAGAIYTGDLEWEREGQAYVRAECGCRGLCRGGVVECKVRVVTGD